MNLISKINLLSLLVTLLFLSHGCGPEKSEDSPVVSSLDALASCFAEASGVCLNYVEYPDGTTEEEIEELCDEPSKWSEEACSTANVFGQCYVEFQGGTVVTYFFPPQTIADAEASCANQNGDYSQL